MKQFFCLLKQTSWMSCCSLNLSQFTLLILHNETKWCAWCLLNVPTAIGVKYITKSILPLNVADSITCPLYKELFGFRVQFSPPRWTTGSCHWASPHKDRLALSHRLLATHWPRPAFPFPSTSNNHLIHFLL